MFNFDIFPTLVEFKIRLQRQHTRFMDNPVMELSNFDVMFQKVIKYLTNLTM